MKWQTGLVGLLFVFTACAKKSASSSSDTPSSSAGDNFTVAALAKSWTGNCEVGAEPITGDDHYQTTMSLGANGSFSSSIQWYTGTCSPVNRHIIYTVYGTYQLSDYVSGSSLKVMSFTINFVNYNGTDLMTYGNTIRSAYNTSCGGTSPFQGGAHATDGGHVDTQYMTCSGEQFPNAVARPIFQNTATYDGTTLSLGAFSTQNVPGSFPGATLPVTTPIAFH